MAKQATTVDEYISSCPDDVQEILREIRRRLHSAVPDTGETISYGIPTITRGGKHLVYFGAWKTHISVYPVPSGDEAMEQDLAPYRSGKGTLKFGLRKPIPYELIARVAAALAEQRS
ncbi:MAG: iron chaperone [Streptosporangiaceae bacterium]